MSNRGGALRTLAMSNPKPDTIMRPPMSFWTRRSCSVLRDFGQWNRGTRAPAFGRTLPTAMKKSASTNVIALKDVTE